MTSPTHTLPVPFRPLVVRNLSLFSMFGLVVRRAKNAATRLKFRPRIDSPASSPVALSVPPPLFSTQDSSHESPDAPAPEAARSARESVLAGKRVIICEDEGISQMQLRRALAKSGMIVAGTAADGLSGIELARAERPDLIVMDIRMPVMDGIEASRRILRELDTCIVMLTAFSDEDYKDQAMEAGACGYIVKPVTGETLLPQLEHIWTDFNERKTEPAE